MKLTERMFIVLAVQGKKNLKVKIKSRITVCTAQPKALLLPEPLLEVQTGACFSQNLFS